MTRRPTPHRHHFYLPEAARLLGVPLRTIAFWVYHPLYRHTLSHQTTRRGSHPRRHRILTEADLETLALLALTRSTRLLGRPLLRLTAQPLPLSRKKRRTP